MNSVSRGATSAGIAISNAIVKIDEEASKPASTPATGLPQQSQHRSALRPRTGKNRIQLQEHRACESGAAFNTATGAGRGDAHATGRAVPTLEAEQKNLFGTPSVLGTRMKRGHQCSRETLRGLVPEFEKKPWCPELVTEAEGIGPLARRPPIQEYFTLACRHDPVSDRSDFTSSRPRIDEILHIDSFRTRYDSREGILTDGPSNVDRPVDNRTYVPPRVHLERA